MNLIINYVAYFYLEQFLVQTTIKQTKLIK